MVSGRDIANPGVKGLHSSAVLIFVPTSLFFKVYEMIAACYQFVVLNNAYTSHWGFSGRVNLFSLERAKQTIRNEKKYKEFFKEIGEKYGKQCQIFGKI